MARKLKTYQTSIGFYDLAVAVPSMKAALEAWGAHSNLFHQGVAVETDEAAVIAATLALSFAVGACNTVAGAGQDIQKGGEKIEKAADKARP